MIGSKIETSAGQYTQQVGFRDMHKTGMDPANTHSVSSKEYFVNFPIGKRDEQLTKTGYNNIIEDAAIQEAIKTDMPFFRAPGEDEEEDGEGTT